jgi:hypothetical protein
MGKLRWRLVAAQQEVCGTFVVSLSDEAPFLGRGGERRVGYTKQMVCVLLGR